MVFVNEMSDRLQPGDKLEERFSFPAVKEKNSILSMEITSSFPSVCHFIDYRGGQWLQDMDWLCRNGSSAACIIDLLESELVS